MLVELSEKELKLIDLSLKYVYENGFKFAQFEDIGINEARKIKHFKLLGELDKLRLNLAKQYKTIKAG